MTRDPKAETDFPDRKSAVRISVITVCRNAAAHVLQTIHSVAAQTVRDKLEYLIIDGASTDGTLELVQAAALSGQVDRWISEPDKGIYDAMNKAIGIAHGEWVLFMNSADVFDSNNSVEQILPFLSEGRPDAPDLVYGDCIMIYPNGKAIYDVAQKPGALTHRMICSHQSLFARRSLALLRPFDVRFTICADYDFLLGAWKAGARLQHVQIPVARVQLEVYSFGQISSGHKQKREAAMARLGYWARWRFDLGWIALAGKHLLKRILGVATLRIANTK